MSWKNKNVKDLEGEENFDSGSENSETKGETEEETAERKEKEKKKKEDFEKQHMEFSVEPIALRIALTNMTGSCISCGFILIPKENCNVYLPENGIKKNIKKNKIDEPVIYLLKKDPSKPFGNFDIAVLFQSISEDQIYKNNNQINLDLSSISKEYIYSIKKSQEDYDALENQQNEEESEQNDEDENQTEGGEKNKNQGNNSGEENDDKKDEDSDGDDESGNEEIEKIV